MTATISEAERWDVIVVGAGPAGALAARQLALQDQRVLLVERARFPRHKVCGGCLGGRALEVLRSVGLGNLVGALGGVPTEKFCWAAGRRRVDLPLAQGMAVSRAALDAALVEAAVAAGVEFLPETTARLGSCHAEAREVELVGPDTNAHVAQARVVIAADGLAGSLQSRTAANRRQVSKHSYIGAGSEPAVIDSQLPAGTLLMACAPRGYVGVTHVEAGQIELAAAFAPEFLRDCSSLGAAANQVLQAAGMSPVVDAEAFTWRGTPALTSVAPEVTAERLFAIGDATGYVEPFTGEGIAWAMTAAVQVVPLVERATESWSTDLADQWRQQAAQISRRQQRFCRLMSRLLRHPLGVQATLGLLSVVPQLATPFVRWRDAPATLPPLFSSKVTP